MLDQAVEGLSEKLELQSHQWAVLRTAQTPPWLLVGQRELDWPSCCPQHRPLALG